MGQVVSAVAAAASICHVILDVVNRIRSSIVGENPTLASMASMEKARALQQQAQNEERRIRQESNRLIQMAEESRSRADAIQEETQRTVDAARARAESTRNTQGAALSAAQIRERDARKEAESARNMAGQKARELNIGREGRQLALIDAQREEERLSSEIEKLQRIVNEERRKATAAQHAAEEAVKAADQKAQEARGAQERAEEELRKGVQPIITPSAEQRRAAKKKVQYKEGLFHFAVAGVAGGGKSSLVNAIRGVLNRDPGAAATGVVETTTTIGRYPDPNSQNPFVWYDIPGAGTLTTSDWMYFNQQGLYVFDCVIVLWDNRFTMTDIAILTNCRRFKIPTYIVRSKADVHIRNLMKDMGYDSETKTDKRTHFVAARAKYIADTRESVRQNLREVSLPDQRVYIISNETLCSVVQGQISSNWKAIDELELLRDLLNTAYLRRCRQPESVALS